MPVGTNKIFDLFKEYAIEVKGGAISGDSFMMIISVLLASLFAGLNINTNIIIIVFTVYLIPYLINIQSL
jgi:hypothetical protein